MKLTVDLVQSWSPCSNWTRERMQEVIGSKRKSMTPLQLARVKGISAADKLWVLLREEICTSRELRLLACLWAERVLPIFVKKYPEDKRPRKAIEIARLFADGNKATQEELDAARAAARDAARAAAWDAAGAAAGDAARAAAWAAAGDAARDAAWAAAGAAAWAAAWDAARAAAGDAAGDAAGAAAGDAAWAEARDAQLQDVVEVLRRRYP